MTLLYIIPNAPTAFGYVFSGIISLMMVMCVWPVRKYPHKLTQEGILFALFLCLVYSLFPMGGSDFYDYKEWVEKAGYIDIDSIPFYYEHYEKPYYVIINVVQNNYFLFRMAVWGGSLLLYWRTAKRLRIDKSTFVFFLCICVVQLNVVSRVALSGALFFYGFSFIVRPMHGRSVISLIIGFSVVLFSMLFHRSALFLLGVLPLSLITINKKTLLLLALVFPVIILIINTDLFSFLLNFDQTEDSLLDAGTAKYYLESDKKRVVGLGQGIEFAMKYGSHIVMVILIIKKITDRSYKNFPVHVQKYTNATLFITLLASSILLTPGAATFKTFERLIGFTYLPQSFLLAYLLKTGDNKKLLKAVYLLLTGYVVYGTLYYNFYFAFTDF